MIILAVAVNLWWFLAGGRISGQAAGQAAPEARDEDVADPIPVPPVPEITPPPAETLAPDAASTTVETSPATEAVAEDPPPPAAEGPIPALSPPDGMPPAGLSPLPSSPDSLALETATPFSLPVTESPVSGSLEGSENLESGEPAAEADASTDDRSAPWIAAPGGFSMPNSGGFGNGLPAAPSGFTSVNPVFPMGGVTAGEGIFEGFSIAATFSGTYTTNATSSPGEPFAPILDDFIFGLGGSISYLSKATDWTFGGSYSGNYNQYLDLSEYSGYNQSLGLVGNYDGSKLSATLNLGISYDQGTNRYYSSEFVEQTTINTSLNLRYRLSSKTSLQGDIGQVFTLTSGNNDTENFSLGLAALWKYSKLTELGPGVRFTYLSGGSQETRTAIGPELLVNYQLAKKVSLNSRVGVDFATYEDGGAADPALTGSIGVNYNASKRWGMNLALFRGVQANGGSADIFTEVSSVRLGYTHRIRRATLNLGVAYEIDSYQTADNSTTAAYPDRNFFNIDSSLGMAVFSNTCYASVFMRYNDQSGSATETWDAVQSGFSITRRF